MFGDVDGGYHAYKPVWTVCPTTGTLHRHTTTSTQRTPRCTYADWGEYFNWFHNWVNPNWGNNPIGPVVKNSDPETSQGYQTPPVGETEVESTGVDSNMEDIEEAEALLDEIGAVNK